MLEEIYDEVSHEFDDQVKYKILPQFSNCYVFYWKDLRAHSYETEHPKVMKKLLNTIRRYCIYSSADDVYIIEENDLMEVLQNFYKQAEEEE